MHEYTVERIYHFTCSQCKNWWSYAGDCVPEKQKCPHCSLEQKSWPKGMESNRRWWTKFIAYFVTVVVLMFVAEYIGIKYSKEICDFIVRHF